MLKSGRIPEERQGTIVEMIGKRGTPVDLDFLFDRLLAPDGFSPGTRLKALEALQEAALARGTRPAGELGRLQSLIEQGGQKSEPAARLTAVRIAGLWRAEGTGEALAVLAAAPDTNPTLRAAALDSLASIGGKAGRASIEALVAAGQKPATRALAVAALVKLDIDTAAARAIEVLTAPVKDQDLTPLLAAFLNKQGGADKLASALAARPIPADPAKLALRAVYTLGRSDAALVSALTRAAKIDAEVKPLDRPAMDQALADVATLGDAARGEAVFRRADLSCSKCHALSGAGGGIGPDLSALGSSSPVDYVINSLMLPDQAIKEEFQTLVVQTTDGQVFHGIVADRDDKRIVLKEATGDLRTIPASDIEESKEGGSLMPKGLVNFMTRAEFLDVVRFLSELGKPGPYAIRSSPTVQRWRFLSPVPAELAEAAPDAETFRSQIWDSDPAQWQPAYAKVAGALPLDEVARAAESPVLYLQAEVDVSHADKVNVRLN
jgi:putative heme-binding domain-containing protein